MMPFFILNQVFGSFALRDSTFVIKIAVENDLD
jgi:hypothetical protein